MDPRANWILTKPEDFFSDLGTIGGYYQDLAGYPRVWEVTRFPGLEECSDGVAQNHAYAAYLHSRSQVLLHQQDRLREALGETAKSGHAWEVLRVARNPDWWVGERRRSLQKLREVLGDDDFYSGRMPPPAPLQFFQEVQ